MIISNCLPLEILQPCRAPVRAAYARDSFHRPSCLGACMTFLGSAATPIDGTCIVNSIIIADSPSLCAGTPHGTRSPSRRCVSRKLHERACLVAQLGDLSRAVRMLDACRMEHSCHLDSCPARWHSITQDDDEHVPQPPGFSPAHRTAFRWFSMGNTCMGTSAASTRPQ